MLTLLAEQGENSSFSPLPQFAQGLGEAHTSGSDALMQQPEKLHSSLFFPRASLPHSKASACLHKFSPAAFLQQAENLKGVVGEIKFEMLFLSSFTLPVLQVIPLKWRWILWWTFLYSHRDFENLEINWIHYCDDLGKVRRLQKYSWQKRCYISNLKTRCKTRLTLQSQQMEKPWTNKTRSEN